MSAPGTMTGARALVQIVEPGKPARTVGILNNISWGLQFDAQAIFTLGRFSPQSIEYTGQEPVGITASGWRVVGHGAHKEGGVPRLQDLLNSDYLAFQVVDRQTNRRIATFSEVRATGYTTSLSERQLQSMQLSFIGIHVSDEDTDNVESAGSAILPTS